MYIYTMEDYSGVIKIEKNNIMKFTVKQMEPEKNKNKKTFLSEVTYSQKDKHGMQSLMNGY